MVENAFIFTQFHCIGKFIQYNSINYNAIYGKSYKAIKVFEFPFNRIWMLQEKFLITFALIEF